MPPETKRRRALAALHVRRTQLGIDENTYRNLLWELTGKTSAGQMSDDEIGRCLDEFRRRGARSHRTMAPDQSPAAPQLRLAIAIWRDLADMGVLHDPSDAALRTFAKRLTGVATPEWLNVKQMNVLIESLKVWRRREREKQSGGNDNECPN
ncbi:MAG TPA: regulatory protein GemA [Candidatus Binataceae bacterium]|nr:regulatory protein GemA [Candidatus Binataceae bacterium]